MLNLEERIFKVNLDNFEELALEIFQFQYRHCDVYQNFVNALGKTSPKTLLEIPFLPISFFKTHEVYSGEEKGGTLFLSSGTTKQERSKHWILKTELYQKSFVPTYEQFTGKLENQVILALLPNYIEQGNSSLVYMVDYLINQTNSDLSGFFIDDFQALLTNYQKALQLGKKVIIFGVSYALLDLAELKPDLSKAVLIETGGMKGRRKELTKEELHNHLKEAFRLSHISSEYGMTELLSQAYLSSNGYFSSPNWMRILIRDTNDPFSYEQENKTGGINVVDLANLYSCSFIATQDLGQVSSEGFKLMGRFDHSDIRGCNLMVE